MIFLSPNNSTIFLIFVTIVLFFISLNLKISLLVKFLRKVFGKIFFRKERNYTNKDEIINQYIPQEEIKNLIQEDLPFIKNEKKENIYHNKFKLPLVDLLKSPSVKDKEKFRKEKSC